nr:hypothetical protein [Klebsiella pneumoniae]
MFPLIFLCFYFPIKTISCDWFNSDIKKAKHTYFMYMIFK